MAKKQKQDSDAITCEGQVIRCHRGAIFDVRLENGHVIRAHVSGNIRRNKIKIMQEDVVTVELSMYNLDAGRIIYRFR